MSIGTEVIKDGLRKIGAYSSVQPPDPESIVEGMKTLNDMLQNWQSQGIQLGIVPLFEPGEELSEPAGSRNAIVSNLALLLAPNFDNGEVIVSQTLKSNATVQFNNVKDLYQKFNIPEKGVSSTLPLGQGNRWGFWSRTFAGRNAKIE